MTQLEDALDFIDSGPKFQARTYVEAIGLAWSGVGPS